MHGELSDKELVLRLKDKSEGWEESMNEIMRRYKNSVYVYILGFIRNSHLAEDVLQEVFIKFYLSIRTFNPDMKISGWLFRIAHNQCIDTIRKKKLQYDDGQILERQYTETSGDTELIASDVRSVISQLDEESKSVLIMRDALGYDYSEIAGTFDIPIGTVKSRISRARSKFKELWDQLMARGR